MEPNPNYSMKAIGRVVTQPSAYGATNAVIKLHIFASETDGSDVYVAGNAPFTVDLKINGELVRTVTDIPACENPAYLNQIPENGPICEYNCVLDNLPPGLVSIICTDSIGNDCRLISAFNIVQPPFATLNADVDPMGLDTEVTFEFGLTDAYGRVAAFGTINGFGTKHCSLQLRSQVPGSENPVEFLLPNTEYHFRVRAVNSLGEAVGADMVFTTPSYNAPPVAVTLPATGIS